MPSGPVIQGFFKLLKCPSSPVSLKSDTFDSAHGITLNCLKKLLPLLSLLLWALEKFGLEKNPIKNKSQCSKLITSQLFYILPISMLCRFLFTSIPCMMEITL